jgi:3-phosphoshikimate 1-carboxyvinyltransferase
MKSKFYQAPKVFQGKWKINLPPSKSLSNRAILLASFSKGESCLKNLSKSRDTQYLLNICHKLGADIAVDLYATYIKGISRVNPVCEDLFFGNAGSSLRFILPMLLLGRGKYKVVADSYMDLRSHYDFVVCLEKIGLKFNFLKNFACTPFEVVPNLKNKAELIEINCEKSSQFLSSLLMFAPLLDKKMIIKAHNKKISLPYLQMTLDMMKQFGVSVTESNSQFFLNGKNCYSPANIKIEPDASSASYFFALAAVSAGEITIPVADWQKSIQGDWGFVNILKQMGCVVDDCGNSLSLCGTKKLKAITVDMGNMPDVVPALVCVCALAVGVSKIYNISHLRTKECDRIDALVSEFKKLGVNISAKDDVLWVVGREKLKLAVCNSHGDHRIAMSLAILGSQIGGVQISNFDCVDKSYPNFYNELQKCS